MIVDAFTQIWESPKQLGRCFENPASKMPNSEGLASEAGFPRTQSFPSAPSSRHLLACEAADRAIVMGFKSHYLEANIPNTYVAHYVGQHPEKLIGFASVDPSQPQEALADIEEAIGTLGMKGIAIAPAAQDFHPASSSAQRVYEKASELQLPILVHQGIYFAAQNKLEYARPVLLDEVARDFPDLKIIIAHMGYPWVDETVVLLGKHANLYADVSGLVTQPWQAYNALLSAFHYGVIKKLLFGSGFPFTAAATCIEALYSINQLCHGTNLPTIPREQLRGIVERPTLELLGIPDQAALGKPPPPGSLLDEEEGS